MNRLLELTSVQPTGHQFRNGMDSQQDQHALIRSLNTCIAADAFPQYDISVSTPASVSARAVRTAY